ncbi:MAG: hypothetical protein WC829_05585 [Hyphomicrobium sp.]|jgi:hypothetical protein
MTAPRGAQFAIAPVIGPPEGVSGDLRNQLIADLERQNIRVARAPDERAEYTLRGYVVSSLEKKGNKSKISYIWDVTDSSGKGVHRVSGEETAASGKSKDPWAAVTPTVVQSIAAKTVTSVTGWMPGAGVAVAGGPSGGMVQTAAATSAAPYSAPRSSTVTGSIGHSGPVKALVPTVVGAPGDGSNSLRAALQRELTRSGVSLTEARTTDTYLVEGKVAMGTGKDGKQPITIDWSVTDPSGKKLGTVSQKNEVPQGSLDGSWGKTADAAAAAAAQGIVKLLPQPTQKTSSN